MTASLFDHFLSPQKGIISLNIILYRLTVPVNVAKSKVVPFQKVEMLKNFL